ncbi:unnamed protein product [Prunus armeniaca]
MGEQAVVEDLMAKQAYRIETSFMAAMDRFSSKLRTLFQERMPVTSSATPPRIGQRSQERERFEPYGESSSLGLSGCTQASGYDQHSQPPTNSWGNPSRTDLPSRNGVRPTPCFGRVTEAKQPHTFRGPATWPSSHCGCPDPSRPKQRDCFTITYVVIAVRLPSSVRFDHSNSDTYVPWPNRRRLPNAARFGRNSRASCSSGSTDKASGRCATGPVATSNPAGVTPSGSSDRRHPAHDQGRPGAPSYTELYPPGKPRTWRDLLSKAFWAHHTSKHSVGTFPYVLTYGHDTGKLMELEVRFLRVSKRLRRKMKNYAQTVPRSLEKLRQSRLAAYGSVRVQEKMAPRAYDKKVKKKKRGK